MLVALGARVIYPTVIEDGGALCCPTRSIAEPNPTSLTKWSLHCSEHIPLLLGPAVEVVIVSLILVAIMAASMSTADSNLHALARS